MHFYTQQQSEKEIKKAISFTITYGTKKYELTREAKGLYNEKNFLKEIKEDINKW